MVLAGSCHSRTRYAASMDKEQPLEYSISADALFCAAKKLAEFTLTHGFWSYEFIRSEGVFKFLKQEARSKKQELTAALI